MRVDAWLWNARFFKSRSLAATALRQGRVRINDVIAKPSTTVKISDRVTWRDHLRPREIEVRELLPRRVSAALAAEAFIDHSPPIPTKVQQQAVGLRDRGTGRPTKKERRQIDNLMGFQR